MSYVISVGNAYIADRTDVGGVATFGTPEQVDTIKSVGVTTTKTEAQIWASGKIKHNESRKVSKQLSVGATMLPADIVRKLLGKVVSTNKGFAFESANDVPPEFAFGYVTEYRSGKKKFIWAPRCMLVTYDPTINTKDSNSPDPNESYTLMVMPYGDGDLFEVEYDQTQVVDGKKPLTEAEFFAAVIVDPDDKLIDSEATATP